MEVKINLSVITTVRHNIGDDFVREGIVSILNDVLKIDKIELIHKHSPVTTVYGGEHIRNLRLSRVLEPAFRVVGVKDRIADADLLIQSGAPIYWCHPDGPHCFENEWFDPLIRKRFLKDRRNRKFLNVAGGSCQRYDATENEIEICPKCSAYIREFFDVCDLTILRDKYALAMLKQAGRDAIVLPCTSIFARDRFCLKGEIGEYVVLNFMENGGHYTFGQNIDAGLWRIQFKKIAEVARKYGKVVIACHTPQEEQLARLIVPEFERFLVPDDHIEFMKFYARAKFGIVNRVHAGFMMASLGKPVAVIGNDSRALMIENLDLKSIFVGDVGKLDVESMIADISSRVALYPEEIEAIRSKAKEKYVESIRQAIAI